MSEDVPAIPMTDDTLEPGPTRTGDSERANRPTAPLDRDHDTRVVNLAILAVRSPDVFEALNIIYRSIVYGDLSIVYGDLSIVLDQLRDYRDPSKYNQV
jgi:hypothetical protein